MRTRHLFACLLLLGASCAEAGGEDQDAIQAAKAFGAAIAAGDEATVKRLLAPDVLIYESGGQEASRDEYAGHHMKADMEFMAHAKVRVLDTRHDVGQNLAWVATRSRVTATFNGKAVDMFSTETLVLKQTAEGWRIVHVQWSSQPAAKKQP